MYRPRRSTIRSIPDCSCPGIRMKWYRSLTTRVLGRRDVDSRDARRLSAPAVEAQRRLDSVLLGTLLDPLVDVAEDLLVASSPVGEVHVGDHHGPLRYPPRLTRSNPGYRLSTLRPKLACATGARRRAGRSAA